MQIADRALRIEGDPVRLAQAVSNLLHNAVKYTPEKGCITVNVLADGKDLVVSVKDNGLGISAALLPHIFDLFAQSSRTIGASAGGLGVGLAVVKAVAEAHGGTVSATSAGPGTGSEFTLRLPIVLGAWLPSRRDGGQYGHTFASAAEPASPQTTPPSQLTDLSPQTR